MNRLPPDSLPREIAEHLPQIRALAVRYDLRSVAIIGSAASGGFDPDRSDLDLLVDFGEYTDDLARRATGFWNEVRGLLGRSVDVVSVHGIRSDAWRRIHAEQQIPVYVAA